MSTSATSTPHGLEMLAHKMKQGIKQIKMSFAADMMIYMENLMDS